MSALASLRIRRTKMVRLVLRVLLASLIPAVGTSTRADAGQSERVRGGHAGEENRQAATDLSPGPTSSCDEVLTRFYARTAWPGVHRDPSNSDFLPFVAPTVRRVLWTTLDGASVLAHPSIGHNGTAFVTTGQGPGTSHLHVYDRSGHLLWESDPQESLDDLDSGAAFNAPVIDLAGDVYVADTNQLWAFCAGGSLKWVVNLPDAGSSFAGAVLTKEGLVGGITTNGKVVFFDRADGSLAVPIIELPGGSGPTAPPTPPGLWAAGLVDPAIIDQLFRVLFGYEVEVANAPAVHPRTGRIYITAAGATPNEGVLYGLDIQDGSVEIAFQTPMAGGSGTSPAISPNGSQVYAVGGDNALIAFDAETGEPRWSAEGAGAEVSPAIGPDGTIYSGGGEFLVAFDPVDGSTRWRVNFDSLAEAFLPRLPFARFLLGSPDPVARTNSVVSLSAGQLWVALVLGYEFMLTGSPVLQPRVTVLASIDPQDGSLLATTVLRDTCEGTISLGSDGQVYVRHAAMLSSIFYFAINPILPPLYDIPGPPPAGLSVVGPVSLVDQAATGSEWALELTDNALADLSAGDLVSAEVDLCRGSAQLAAALVSVFTSKPDTLDPTAADSAISLLREAAILSDTARENLGVDPVGAEDSILLAQDAVFESLEMLGLGGRTIDLMPGICPNTLRLSRLRWGTTRLAIAGSPTLDVSRLSDRSLVLSRADGLGGVIRPIEQRGGSVIRFDDVIEPAAGGLCECWSTEPDGLPDALLAFSTRELTSILELDSLAPGRTVPLALRGALKDGTPFTAYDCVQVGTGRRERR